MGRYVEAGRANIELSNERRSDACGSVYNVLIRGQDAERGFIDYVPPLSSTVPERRDDLIAIQGPDWAAEVRAQNALPTWLVDGISDEQSWGDGEIR